MRKSIFITFMMFFAVLLFGQDIPHVISYQGKFLDGDAPANDYYYFRYVIFSPGAVPETLWVQAHSGGDSIYVNNGLFSDTLGLQIDTAFTKNANLWLKVFVQKPPFNSANWTALGDGEKLWASPWALTIADTAITDNKIRWSSPGAAPNTGQVSAADIPIHDAGGYYTPDNVEAALQQIAGGGGSGQWSDSITYITNNNASSNDLRVRIYNNGSVDIGVIGSSYKLDVDGTGHLTGNLTIGAYTLPNIDGTNGQVLKTNGSGTINWSTITEGGENLAQTLTIGNSAGTNSIDMNYQQINNVATPTISSSTIGNAVSTNFLIGEAKSKSINYCLYRYH